MKKSIFTRVLSVGAAAVCMISALEFTRADEENAFAADTMTAFEITENMQIGWNIGNSLDATGSGSNPGLSTETAWGNPKITQELINAVKAKGFNTIRIPTTWYQHLDENNNIDAEWLARVHEVVDYCYNQDLYVILNLHHEEWVNRADLGTAYEEMKPKLLTIWKQLADEFSDYGQRLIFECMNEPRAVGTDHEWWGPLQSEVDTINQLNADFVNLIRSDDSPYADTRLLMIPGYCASSDLTMISKIVVPDDEYVAVSIHAYSPYNFTMNTAVADHSTFTDAYANELTNILSGIRTTFIAKDIPVVIGEFGASNYNNTEARCEWAELYISTTKAMGVPCVLWDNNEYSNSLNSGEAHGYINRNTLEWYEGSEDVVDTMMSVLADDSIAWGGESEVPTLTHDDIDSGETLYKDSTGQSIDAAVANGNCSANYDVPMADLAGKDVAVKFTGDAPVFAYMDANWENWTEVNPYEVDYENGIAYFSGDAIIKACGTTCEGEHFCFRTNGTTTILQISIINAAEGEIPEEEAKFKTQTYSVDLEDKAGTDGVISFTLEYSSDVTEANGCLGYSNDGLWESVEWTASLEDDGSTVVEISLADIPANATGAQFQIWWADTNLEDESSVISMTEYWISLPDVIDVEYGDADLDGVVSIADVVLVMCHASNKSAYPLSDEALNCADVYQRGDGVGASDALSIQKKLAQILTELPESVL